MKSVTMFILESCPHCIKARKWMQELQHQEPRYQQIKVQLIDEGKQPDIAAQYDYYYVPTYYVDGQKIHEGAATMDIVRRVFETACQE